MGFPGGAGGKEPICQGRRYKEMWILLLGQEDPLEEGMATNSSVLAWRIPMGRGTWRATVHTVAKSRSQLKQFSDKNIFRVISKQKNFLANPILCQCSIF